MRPANAYAPGGRIRSSATETALRQSLKSYASMALRGPGEPHVLRIMYEEGPQESTIITFLGEGLDMKIRYTRKEDMLINKLSSDSIEYPEETGPFLAHFSTDGKLVLVELVEASDFLAKLAKITMTVESEKTVEV